MRQGQLYRNAIVYLSGREESDHAPLSSLKLSKLNPQYSAASSRVKIRRPEGALIKGVLQIVSHGTGKRRYVNKLGRSGRLHHLHLWLCVIATRSLERFEKALH